MRFLNIEKDFRKGYLIGDFSPSIYTSKDVEIGHARLPKNHQADGHYHKLSTEYNLIIKGSALVEGQVLTDGDIFVYEKGDRANVKYLEETDIVIIKLPSVQNDKYYD